ncbi:MAG: glycoside hydrolase family 3 C-terminal domain-containing protein [Clostridiales bacterium]|nr:glycoside hydrolase family 3 C-terminal domain-containing protein [Clostridiales bacterium]
MEKYKDPSLSFQERAEDLADKMTFEEQVPQLSYGAPAIDRLGVPAYNWWNEGLHGVARAGTATMFPQAIGLAAMFDDKLLGKVAKIIATEARAKYNASSKKGDRDIYKGLTLWSPNINIFRDPRWGRGHETYGEDPYLTTKLGVSFVKNLQGDGKFMMAAGCAKHFAAHSGPEALRHEFNTIASKKDLAETYLPAFEALVKEAKVEGVMGAYTRLNGDPTCASPFLMGKLKEWGFDGYFVSDCWAIRDFHESHHVTKTPTESAAMAINAGCDLNCGNTYVHMIAAEQEGLVSKETIRKAVVNLMRTRMRLGLFEEHTEFDDIPYDVVACDEHRKVSLECAEKSMVLLKNDGMLPLKKESLKSIAVIGPNSDSIDALRGNYYGTSIAPKTFLEGIRDEVSGTDIRVYYAEGASLSNDRIQPLAFAEDGIAEALILAEMSDAVVLCVGLDATLEGEQGDTGNAFDSGDKRDLLLPEGQRVLVEKVLALGKPTVVVLAAGSSINPLAEKADALIQAWYPGELGGTALANILFGKVSPSGKLPLTFYQSIEGIPDFADYSMKDRTYRYTRKNILYPFGYGLTYSKVVVTDCVYDDSTAKASVTVQNQGDVDTEDVVQLYIHNTTSANATPFPKLCGFKRVAIPAGEEIVVELTIEDSAFDVVNDEGEVIREGNTFDLFAGVSQPDELSRELTGSSCVRVSVVK